LLHRLIKKVDWRTNSQYKCLLTRCKHLKSIMWLALLYMIAFNKNESCQILWKYVQTSAFFNMLIIGAHLHTKKHDQLSSLKYYRAQMDNLQHFRTNKVSITWLVRGFRALQLIICAPSFWKEQELHFPLLQHYLIWIATIVTHALQFLKLACTSKIGRLD
jgi:hypothetical protein